MSAETLRRAAALMRERAKAVPPEGLADWWFDVDAPDLMHLRPHDREQIATFGHPRVALAVADFLDSDATMCEECHLDEAVAAVEAFSVARAYLGHE